MQFSKKTEPIPEQLRRAAIKAETALVPAIPEHHAQAVVAGMQQGGDIIRLDLHPGTVFVAEGCQEFLSYLLSVDLRFVQTGSGGIQSGMSDFPSGFEREFLAQQRRHILVRGCDELSHERLTHFSGFEHRGLRHGGISVVCLYRHAPVVLCSGHQRQFGHRGIRKAVDLGPQTAVVDNGPETFVQRDFHARGRLEARGLTFCFPTEHRDSETESERIGDVIAFHGMDCHVKSSCQHMVGKMFSGTPSRHRSTRIHSIVSDVRGDCMGEPCAFDIVHPASL